MNSIVQYCYFWKFFIDLALENDSLRNRLAESEAKNAKLKETIARQDEGLLLTGPPIISISYPLPRGLGTTKKKKKGNYTLPPKVSTDLHF
jgi:hypothetical protein